MGSIMTSQERTVRSLHGNSDEHVALWHHSCTAPRKLSEVGRSYFFGSGGTSPDCIILHQSAADTLRSSDVWVLLTDGEISEDAVSRLTALADVTNVLQVPVVVWITGKRAKTLEQANISVGISFFASAREAVILFKDEGTKKVYLIDAKGAFATLKEERETIECERNSSPLKSERSVGLRQSIKDFISKSALDGQTDLPGWDSVPVYKNETEFNKCCEETGVALIQHEGRTFTKAISLGLEWDAATKSAMVDVSALLDQVHIELRDLRNLLGEEAITQLALLCKTRGKLDSLRSLLIRNKQQQVIVRLEDQHGAGKIMEQMQADNVTDEEKAQFSAQLQAAHIANRETFLSMKNFP